MNINILSTLISQLLVLLNAERALTSNPYLQLFYKPEIIL